jgi:hypothetical protein
MPRPERTLTDDTPLGPTLVWRLLAFAVATLVVGGASLALAYVGPLGWSSEPWRARYGAHGLAIEAVRLALLLALAGVVVWAAYRPELLLLVRGGETPRDAASRRRWLLALGGSAATLLIILIYTHTGAGPRELEAWFAAHGSAADLDDASDRRLYGRPYLAYLPYSLALWIATALPLVALGMLAGARDFSAAEADRLRFRTVFDEAPRDDDGLIRSEAQERVARALSRYAWSVTEIIRRFSYLATVALIVAAYEVRFGASTLSDQAKAWVMIAYGVLLLTAVLIVLAIIAYEASFSRAGRDFPPPRSSGDDPLSTLGSLVVLRRMRAQFAFVLIATTILTSLVAVRHDWLVESIAGPAAGAGDPSPGEDAPTP